MSAIFHLYHTAVNVYYKTAMPMPIHQTRLTHDLSPEVVGNAPLAALFKYPLLSPLRFERALQRPLLITVSVSYTHLTLPTNREV